MEYNFTGKTVLVTGAGSGIGKGLCLKLSKCGAKVIAVSVIQKELDDLVEEVPSVQPICVDLAKWDETKTALEKVGPVDGLVNNAGIALLSPFFDITEDEFDRSFDVNVKAILCVSQVIGKGMVERKKGSIVNISSIASRFGYENHTVYCGTKTAVDGMTRAMALELGKHNVRVNCVCPVVVLTPLGRQWWAEPSRANPMLNRIPLGRFAEIEDIVNPVMFLLTDNASMINGARLPVDGGHTNAPFHCSE
nr:PREDICTED: L-xylulose reductase-like [Bemisia tabaci]